jgi:anti-sigma factor RsiW
MNCSDASLLIQAYLDNELDAVQSLAISRHMDGCETCAAYYRRHAQVKLLFADGALYRRAPSHLRARLSSHPDTGDQRSSAARTIRRRPLRALALAASFIGIAIFGTSVFVYGLQQRSVVATAAIEEVVSSHLRSMQGQHLIDVVSTDQHTVKPWFDGKLDFSPRVKDLAADGFPLAGGRLDVLQGRSVAALIYHRRLHVINLYQWPSVSDSPPESTTAFDGYNVIRWSSNGMTYVAVSNVSPDDLSLFVRIFRG